MDEHLKRALRTAKRSLEAAEGSTIRPEDAIKVLFDAVHQLVFFAEKLIEERESEQEPQ
jgi:hypothetical protein